MSRSSIGPNKERTSGNGAIAPWFHLRRHAAGDPLPDISEL
jgi:hypothetical protein